jgi:type IV pilus assembly protein PilY1
LGAGAKGVFALDVTDPAGASIGGLAFDEANASKIALWEFTDSATPNDMGHVLGRPTIARVRTGTNTAVWAAIFGNGYNSTNERAILYIVNIATGAIIRKIDLSNGAIGTGNGLSTVAVVDTNGDYRMDYVYAGDLLGNLWKVNLTDNNSANWGSYYTKSGNPAPLFIATDSNGSRQPITVRPEVGQHPDGESGYMVYFGTGKYLEDGDKTAPTTFPPGNYNYFYGIWDPHSGASIGGSATSRVSKTRLRNQTVSAVTYSGTEYRTVTDNKLGVAGTQGDDQSWGDSGTACNSAGGNCMGWVDSLPGAGEMMVSNPVLLGGSVPRIIFTTIVPESAACSYGGQSWLMELNPIHGGRFTSDVFGLTPTIGSGATAIVGVNPQIGIMPEPTILRDPSNSRDLKILTGSSGTVTSVANSSGKAKGGRQSWRQLK